VRLALRQAQEALGVLLAEDGPIDADGEPALEAPSTLDESAWMTARPDLVVQAARIRAAERLVRDSWKDVSPFAEATFTPRYVAPAGLFQPSRTWRLTISVTQPVFQGGLQRAVTRERQVLFDASRIALTGLEIQARSEVRLAQAALASLESSLGSARRASEQAEEVLRITTTAFEVGATTNIEVIDAQRSARDAETTVALAQDAVQRARLDLLVAVGQFPR
jgi:outer membrane protein TolC